MRAELHAHTSDDREDHLPYTARELVARAGALGYGALAITLHDTVWDPAPLAPFARDHGVRLIAGVERTIQGRHVLLLNFPAAAMLAVTRFEDVGALKAAHPRGLVIAPHPCFPIGSSVGREGLDAHRSLWDAVEVNAMHVRGVDWNRDAVAWATTHGVPLVGNGDVHRLSQLGTTWSEVDVDVPPAMAAGDAADAICDAIRQGRVRVVSSPLAPWRAAALFAQMQWSGARGRWRR